ncbi:hypothetical protein [Nitrosovibrio tenuis]|uniref:hypothetical protein n=1 Tax=Nitrosovibrio tenuis TaxID=1233 RepID=UPI00115F97AF|nr:hypothetical protein [Nitrosovibrio tenuis]
MAQSTVIFRNTLASSKIFLHFASCLAEAVSGVFDIHPNNANNCKKNRNSCSSIDTAQTTQPSNPGNGYSMMGKRPFIVVARVRFRLIPGMPKFMGPNNVMSAFFPVEFVVATPFFSNNPW